MEDVGADEVTARRAATPRLGAQLRALNHAMVASEVPVEILNEATEALRQVTDALAETSRAPGEMASVDDFGAGIRMFNASSGAADPAAPPVVAEHDHGRVVGRATLGQLVELNGRRVITRTAELFDHGPTTLVS